MLVFLIAFTVGCATGILSAFGVGGGTLLILYLTLLAGFSQTDAQGINLLYFLPTAAIALFAHQRNGYLPLKQVVLPAAAAGALSALLGALVSMWLETGLLRKLFGGYLLIVGIVQLFRKAK